MASPIKGLAILVANKAKGMAGKGKDEPDGDEKDDGDDYSMGLESAMSDFIAAVKKGDAEAAAQAFKDAHDLCAE